MEDLLKFDFKRNYLVFDFETEGLNLIRSKPWQLAWLEATGKKINKKQNRFIYWKDLNVSEQAAKITKFDIGYFKKTGVKNKTYKVDGEVFKAEDPESVFDDFDKLLYNPEYHAVGQNILGYDVYIHNLVRILLGKGSNYSYIDRAFDTKALSAAWLKEISLDKNNISELQYKLLNYKKRGFKTSQKTMLDKLSIEHDSNKLHDALYDIEMTFKIFWELLNKINV